MFGATSFRPNVCVSIVMHFPSIAMYQNYHGLLEKKKSDYDDDDHCMWNDQREILLLFICSYGVRVSGGCRHQNSQQKWKTNRWDTPNHAESTQLIPKWLKNRTTFVPTPLFNDDHFDWAFFTPRIRSERCSRCGWMSFNKSKQFTKDANHNKVAIFELNRFVNGMETKAFWSMRTKMIFFRFDVGSADVHL